MTQNAIVEVLPLTLSGSRAIRFANDNRFDVQLNDMVFMLRSGKEHAYQRGAKTAQKEQVDSSNSVGEHSLANRWVRSQEDWSMGAGITYYDPGVVKETDYRFHDSQGINVWETGELTLLRRMDKVDVPLIGNTLLTSYGDGVIVVDSNAWRVIDANGDEVYSLLKYNFNHGTIAVNGDVVWITTNNTITKWNPKLAPNITLSFSVSDNAKVWVAKNRVIIAVGTSLYWLPPDASNISEAVFIARQTDDFDWVAVGETADSILAVGNRANNGEVYALNLDESSGLPVFAGLRQVAQLPRGEKITCATTYLSAYMLLGTTNGIRVAQVGDNGRVLLGGLFTHTVTNNVIVTKDYAIFSVAKGLPDGSTGALRVSLREISSDARTYPYAWDVSTDYAGSNPHIAFLGDTARVVIASGVGLFIESDTDYVYRGWLSSGFIRLGTTENKRWERLTATGEVSKGAVTVKTGISHSNPSAKIFYTPRSGIGWGGKLGERNSVQLGITIELTASDDNSYSPIVNTITLEAMPMVKRQRLIRLPLQLGDIEITRYGATAGYNGFALDRLRELEALQDAGAEVVLVDNRLKEIVPVTIEEMIFTSTSNTDGGKDNVGGVLDLVVHTVN